MWRSPVRDGAPNTLSCWLSFSPLNENSFPRVLVARQTRFRHGPFFEAVIARPDSRAAIFLLFHLAEHRPGAETVTLRRPFLADTPDTFPSLQLPQPTVCGALAKKRLLSTW